MNKNNAYQEALGVLSYSQEQKDLIAANAAAEAMKSRRSHRIHFPFGKIKTVIKDVVDLVSVYGIKNVACNNTLLCGS